MTALQYCIAHSLEQGLDWWPSEQIELPCCCFAFCFEFWFLAWTLPVAVAERNFPWQSCAPILQYSHLASEFVWWYRVRHGQSLLGLHMFYQTDCGLCVLGRDSRVMTVLDVENCRRPRWQPWSKSCKLPLSGTRITVLYWIARVDWLDTIFFFRDSRIKLSSKGIFKEFQTRQNLLGGRNYVCVCAIVATSKLVVKKELFK